MCEFYKKCPSATGWCLGKTTLENDCLPFIFQGIENLREEIKDLRDEKDHLYDILTSISNLITNDEVFTWVRITSV